MKNLIIFGAPGSGKGTQSERIAERYELDHISTGDILRREIAEQTDLGQLAQAYIAEGQLVPDKHIVAMLEEYIQNRHTQVAGFIFDGFPRTLAQAEALENMLAEHHYQIDAVLNLDVPEKELMERIIKRGKLSGRADDNEITVAKRLAEYHDKTEPLIAYFQEKGVLENIKGFGSIEEIFQYICKIIDNLEESKS